MRGVIEHSNSDKDCKRVENTGGFVSCSIFFILAILA